MKISLSWLNEFVDIEDYFSKPQVFAEALTFAGLEVESIENLSEKFSHIQIGLILKKEKHPEADRLTVCQVTTGQGIIHQIVCGAKIIMKMIESLWLSRGLYFMEVCKLRSLF